MGAKTFTKKIGDNNYTFRMLTFEAASDLLALLGNEVGGVVGEVSKGLTGGLDAIDEPALAGAVTHLLGNITGARVRVIVGLLCQNTTVTIGGSKEPLILDEGQRELHFGENFHELPAFMDFALRSQFGRFFSSLGALLKGLRPAKESVSALSPQAQKSPLTSMSDTVS